MKIKTNIFILFGNIYKKGYKRIIVKYEKIPKILKKPLEGALTLFMGFYILAGLYGVFSGTFRKPYTDEQIISSIKRDLPSSEIAIQTYKNDIQGFGNESIIVFSGLPINKKAININETYYPKISIFDSKQKNIIEKNLFGNTFYKKAYEVQLIEKEEGKSNIIPGLNPGYELGNKIQKINLDGKTAFIFKWINLKGIDINESYYGIISHDFNKGYTIEPLLNLEGNWINLKEEDMSEGENIKKGSRYNFFSDNQKCSTGAIPLYENIELSVKINGINTNITLSKLMPNDLVIYYEGKIEIYHSLIGINNTEYFLESQDYIKMNYYRKLNNFYNNTKNCGTVYYDFISKNNNYIITGNSL